MQTEPPAQADEIRPRTILEIYLERTVYPTFLFLQAAFVISLILLFRTLRSPTAMARPRQTAAWLWLAISLPMLTGSVLGIAHYIQELRINSPPRFWQHVYATYEAIAKFQVGYWVSLALYVGVTAVLVQRALREKRGIPGC